MRRRRFVKWRSDTLIGILIQILILQSFSSEVSYHGVWAPYPAQIIDAERRKRDKTGLNPTKKLSRNDLGVSMGAFSAFSRT